MNSKPPTNLNRRRSHSLLRWSDVQVITTTTATAAAIWLVAYSITTAILP